jgi:anti-sigma regulatory factor (Ser/Thr protein kinase)
MRLTHDFAALTEARRFVRGWASETALPTSVIDDLVLVVNELVTNAIRHGEPPIDVQLLRATDGTIRGEVGDGSEVILSPNPTPDEHGGFGLHILDSLSARWGVAQSSGAKKVSLRLNRETASRNSYLDFAHCGDADDGARRTAVSAHHTIDTAITMCHSACGWRRLSGEHNTEPFRPSHDAEKPKIIVPTSGR